MNSQTEIAVIHAVKDIAFAIIGAVVFVYGLIHSQPISQMAVEYVAVYGSYFGVHVGTTKASDKALNTQTTKG